MEKNVNKPEACCKPVLTARYVSVQYLLLSIMMVNVCKLHKGSLKDVFVFIFVCFRSQIKYLPENKQTNKQKFTSSTRTNYKWIRI